MLPLLLAVLLSPPVPARAEAPPDRVSANYPKSVYLTGVGEGPTQDKAADKARAEIAKVFSLEIRAQSRSSAREVSDGAGSTYSHDVSDDVRTFTPSLARPPAR